MVGRRKIDVLLQTARCRCGQFAQVAVRDLGCATCNEAQDSANVAAEKKAAARTVFELVAHFLGEARDAVRLAIDRALQRLHALQQEQASANA